MWNVMPLSTALPKQGNLVPRASQVFAVHNKSTPPQQKSCWKISHKGGFMTLDIQIGGGGGGGESERNGSSRPQELH